MLPVARSPAPGPIGRGLPRSRRSPLGALAALLFHLLLGFLILRYAPFQRYDFEASEGSGPGSPGGGGGGGGREVQMVALAAPAASPRAPVPVAPPPVPQVKPPEPVVEPELPVPTSTPIPTPDSVVLAATDSTAGGQGTGSGTGSGSGSGTGTGSGSGSGSGSGRGSGTGPGSGGGAGRARPPEPRQLILPPPDVPGSLRGVTIAVTFNVGPDGRVVDVSFAPEPDDRGFARKLEDILKSYRFRPARGPDGLPIAGTTIVSLTF